METQLAMPLEVDETAEIRTYRLVFPYLPPSKNVYDNWQPAWKAGAKKKWIKKTKQLAVEHQLPSGLHVVGLAARLVFPQNARRDPQNYAQALWNWIPDALVQAGVLIDDRDGCIQIGPNWGIEMAVDRRQTLTPKQRSRTIVTLAHRTAAMTEPVLEVG